MKPIRLVLADDHTLVRSAIRVLLERQPGVEVVAEASTAEEALEAIRAHRPDVVLMDISMGRPTGLEATARVTREFPEVRVLVLSMHTNEEYVLQALRAGALGYVIKNASSGELDLALRTVAGGGTYLSPGVSKAVAPDRVGRIGTRSQLGRLSQRQCEVLRLIAEGLSTRQIAKRLKVSAKTIETHRAELMRRLDIHDVSGLVRFAIQVGLIELNP